MTVEEKKASTFKVFTRFRRLYVGMSLFGFSMIAFTALEFSIYEVLLLATE